MSFNQCHRQLSITNIFKEIWAHFRRFQTLAGLAPETGLSGAPQATCGGTLRPRRKAPWLLRTPPIPCAGGGGGFFVAGMKCSGTI
jgi:hypothetical protein